MAYGRARKATTYGEFWPGYVDVLSTLLLVVTFLMSVFMVAQYYVGQEASGKDTALRRLNRQIAELTNLLSLEKGRGKSLEDELASMQASLSSLRTENGRLSGLAGASGEKGSHIPTSMMSTVVSIIAPLATLCKNGTRLVRMMWMISVCVSSDSTNHPVWKSWAA